MLGGEAIADRRHDTSEMIGHRPARSVIDVDVAQPPSATVDIDVTPRSPHTHRTIRAHPDHSVGDRHAVCELLDHRRSRLGDRVKPRDGKLIHQLAPLRDVERGVRGTAAAVAIASSIACTAGSTGIAAPHDRLACTVVYMVGVGAAKNQLRYLSSMQSSSHEQQIRNLLYRYMEATNNGDFDKAPSSSKHAVVLLPSPSVRSAAPRSPSRFALASGSTTAFPHGAPVPQRHHRARRTATSAAVRSRYLVMHERDFRRCNRSLPAAITTGSNGSTTSGALPSAASSSTWSAK